MKLTKHNLFFFFFFLFHNSFSQNFLKTEGKQIVNENGDTIFIPDKIEYNSWTIFKDILTTLGNVAAIIVVIQNAL